MYEMKTRSVLRARRDFESVLLGGSSDVGTLASYTTPFASAAQLKSKDLIRTLCPTPVWLYMGYINPCAVSAAIK